MQVLISPTHDLTLGDPFAGGDVAAFFAADGRFYVAPFERVLNVWNVLVYYWPEVLGAILGLVLLLVLLVILRVWRRPREAGALYCCRCNYKLEGLPQGALCSECGTDPSTKRPIAGRGFLRRLAMPIGLGVLACLGYGGLHAASVPRNNNATDFLDWSWPALAAFAHDHKIAWLEQHDKHRCSLVEIDVTTGKSVRTVRNFARSSAFRLSPSPDGRVVVTTLSQGELAAIDLHTGRTIRSEPRPDGQISTGNKFGGSCWLHVVGWAGDRTVLVQFLDEKALTHKVYRWDIDTGRLDSIADIPTVSKTSTSRGSSYTHVEARKLYLISAQAPLLATEIPDMYLDREKNEKKAVLLRDLSDGGRVVREITSRFWAGCGPVPFADGSSFLVRGWDGLGISLRMQDGSEIGSLEEPGFMGTMQDGPAGIALHEGSHRLFVATTDPGAVHVRDMEAKKWIARLEFGMYALPDDNVAVSPDGRWVAINVTEVLGGMYAQALTVMARSQFKDHVLIFDLNKLDVKENKTP